MLESNFMLNRLKQERAWLYQSHLFTKSVKRSLPSTWLFILTVGIWTLGGNGLQAVAEDTATDRSPHAFKTSSDVAESLPPVTNLKAAVSESHTETKQSTQQKLLSAEPGKLNSNTNFSSLQTPISSNSASAFTELSTPTAKLETLASKPLRVKELSRSNVKSWHLAESANFNSGITQQLPDLNQPTLSTTFATPIAVLDNSSPPVPGQLSHSKAKDLQLVTTEGSDRSLAQSPTESIPPPSPGAPPSTTSPESPSAPGVPPDQNKTPPPPTSTPPVPPQAPVAAGVFVPDSLQNDFSFQSDNYGLHIYGFEPTMRFRLRNGNRISFKTGFTRLDNQTGFKAVTIYPFRLGWEGNITDRVTLRTGATAYVFDRLPTAMGADAGLTIRVAPNLLIGATVERTPMKYAPSVLERPQKTTFTSYGPNIYWQINRYTSLASFFNFLEFNDGNTAQLSYTKLKRDIGQFSVAANLVTDSFARDASLTSGYFSPPDYLIYNAEVGWQGNLTKYLNLRLQFNYGQQRLQGEFSKALYYEAQLTANLGPDVDAFIKYSYGELDQITYFRQRGATNNSLYNQTLVTGQLRFRF